MEELPIEVGGSRSAGGSTVTLGGSRRPVGFIAIALVVVAVLAVVIGSHRSFQKASPTTSSAPSTTAVSPSTSLDASTIESTAAASPPKREVVHMAGALLPTSPTELIVHTIDHLVRVNLETGDVVWTPMLIIRSGAPTFMVAGSHAVVLRPLDYVDGYFVPDDGMPRPLPGQLADAATFWASPAGPNSIWVQRGDTTNARLDEFGFDGQPNGISVPIKSLVPWGPDGTGQVVVADPGGVNAYVTGGPTLTQVTMGAILAAGPTKWFVNDCDQQTICSPTVVDRKTGTRTALRIQGNTPYEISAGVISPDGRIAAIVEGQPPTLVIIDLQSGGRSGFLTAAGGVAPVWSLDSRYLFFPDVSGDLAMYEPSTGKNENFPISIQNVQALAVRPTS